MKLIGQAKIDFANWYNQNGQYLEGLPVTLNGFRKLHTSMQYGVIVDFADSVGYNITDGRWGQRIYDNQESKTYTCYSHQSKDNYRQESRTEAVKMFCELYNSQTSQ